MMTISEKLLRKILAEQQKQTKLLEEINRKLSKSERAKNVTIAPLLEEA